jgi:XTP/dITP diphosphohydrolase
MDKKIETLLFITSNAHKKLEIGKKLEGLFSITDLTSINVTEDIPEPYATLKENAIAKANYVHDKFKINCFAEDSGLIIEALNGEPGVRSARYAGEEKNDDANIAKVLLNLENNTNRKAYFCTVIALIIHQKLYTFEGRIEGVITTKKIGNSGFGYDPIFIPNGYNETFAEMNLEQKNTISHRAKAVEQMIAFLKNYNQNY